MSVSDTLGKKEVLLQKAKLKGILYPAGLEDDIRKKKRNLDKPVQK